MTISSTLEAVTIYREGAVCQRRATSELKERQLRIGGLPLSADPGSLRARVTAGTARVLDIRPQFDVQVLEEVDVPVEQKAKEAAEEQHAKLALRKQRLDAEIEELTSLRPRFLEQRRGDPPREAQVNSMISMMEFTDAELGARLEQRRALDLELADAARELELRTRRLNEASTAKRTERAKLSRVAVVTLAEAPTAPIELTIEYQVPGVRWVPNYQLKLERGLGAGTLLMRASIAQNSGEDWSQVQLSLSTASLARRTEVPELKAMKIGRRQATPAKSGWRDPPPGLAELFSAYDGATVRSLPPPPQPPTPSFAVAAGPPPPRNQPMEKKKLAKPMAPGAGGAMPPPMAPPAPPPPAPMMERAMMRSMPAPARSAGPLGAMAAVVAAPAAMVADRLRRKEAMEDEAPMESASALMDMDGMAAQSFGEGAPSEPEPPSGPAAALMDYSRLMMMGPAAPTRGKLQPVDRWDSMFVLGVSVQVDVVMAAINRSRQLANEVQSLPLPALCNPVSALDSFDYRYDCEAKADVPSTGKWVSVAVAQCPVGFTPEYVCVPSVEQKVYRTLQITNRGAHALLEGPVDVTAGEEFLMTTRLPAIPPRNELPYRLGLGVEEAIKVSRKTSFKETAGGFLGGSTVLPHDLEIELNNRLSTPALIEVRERVPWVDPEDEKDVKVEEPQVSPPWEKLEKPIDGEAVVRGARRWRVTVPGGQATKLVAQFTIRIPSDRMVVGGNRRN